MADSYMDTEPIGDFYARISNFTPGSVDGPAKISISADVYKVYEIDDMTYHVHKVTEEKNYFL
jgi:hypothetical protein